MARPVVVLPQPLSPTSPSVSPRPTAQAHAVDGAHRPVHPPQEARADREMDFQVVALRGADEISAETGAARADAGTAVARTGAASSSAKWQAAS